MNVFWSLIVRKTHGRLNQISLTEVSHLFYHEFEIRTLTKPIWQRPVRPTRHQPRATPWESVMCDSRPKRAKTLSNHWSFTLFITNLRTRGRRPKGIENRRAKRKSKPIKEFEIWGLRMEFIGIWDEMTSHFVTLLRKVRVACDDNSSKFSSSVYEFSNS